MRPSERKVRCSIILAVLMAALYIVLQYVYKVVVAGPYLSAVAVIALLLACNERDQIPDGALIFGTLASWIPLAVIAGRAFGFLGFFQLFIIALAFACIFFLTSMWLLAFHALKRIARSRRDEAIRRSGFVF